MRKRKYVLNVKPKLNHIEERLVVENDRIAKGSISINFENRYVKKEKAPAPRYLKWHPEFEGGITVTPEQARWLAGVLRQITMKSAAKAL